MGFLLNSSQNVKISIVPSKRARSYKDAILIYNSSFCLKRDVLISSRWPTKNLDQLRVHKRTKA